MSYGMAGRSDLSSPFADAVRHLCSVTGMSELALSSLGSSVAEVESSLQALATVHQLDAQHIEVFLSGWAARQASEDVQLSRGLPLAVQPREKVSGPGSVPQFQRSMPAKVQPEPASARSFVKRSHEGRAEKPPPGPVVPSQEQKDVSAISDLLRTVVESAPSLFYDAGVESAFFKEYGASPPEELSRLLKPVFLRKAKGGSLTVDGASKAWGGLTKYFKFIEKEELEPCAKVSLCKFFWFRRSKATTGGPSKKAHQHLAWADRVFGLSLPVSDPLVLAHAAGIGEVSAPEAKPAQRAPDAVIFELEREVMNEQLPKRRRFRSGCFLCMALGGVRWSEVQWTTSVRLLRDALVFVAAREKVRGKGPHKWAAPRFGPSGLDWGKTFHELWLEIPRPENCDWLLPAAARVPRQCVSLTAGFELEKKAGFGQALSLYRSILQESNLQFSKERALEFSLHGLRAWLDTALRQANFSEDDATLALHWEKNSKMPRHYDRTSVSSEVRVKSRLMAGYRAGWRQVEEGTVPMEFSHTAAPAAEHRDRPRKRRPRDRHPESAEAELPKSHLGGPRNSA